MKKTIKLIGIIALVVVIGFLAMSCPTADPADDSELFPPAGTVYVLGGYYDGDTPYACYWIDGVRTDLPIPAGTQSIVMNNAMAVSGGSVYIAGTYSTGSFFNYDSNSKACYWKDRVRTDLPIPVGAVSRATMIAVSGGSIYIAGEYWTGSYQTGNRTRCYWKDGARTDLPVPAGTQINTAIAVSGGSVYIAGEYDDANDKITACYWKDGVRTDLPVPAGTQISRTNAIAASGGSIYITGGYGATACYWKDGVRTDLTIPAEADGSRIYAMAASGGSVYIAGSDYVWDDYGRNTFHTSSCYWKDGVRTDLALPVGTVWSRTEAITVSGGSVYITGRHADSIVVGDYNSTPCYWKDEVRTDLPAPVGMGGTAIDIAVVE